jgi:hypothetical protein
MKTISAALLGAPLDPFSSQTRQHIALVAFLAWIGLGADGLSSSCYGPEEAFLALGEHTHLALYMAAATALTVFVIAVGYNQVIELFPSGGGGYKVATNLIGPYTGLVSGAALIVDYMLTGCRPELEAVDRVGAGPTASLPQPASIKVLLPIFLGFFVTHVVLILYRLGPAPQRPSPGSRRCRAAGRRVSWHGRRSGHRPRPPAPATSSPTP